MLLSYIFIFLAYLTHRLSHSKKIFNFLFSSLLFIYLTLIIVFYSINYFTGEGINQAVIFQIKSGLNGADILSFKYNILLLIILFFIVFLISFIYYKMLKKQSYKNQKYIFVIFTFIFYFLAFFFNSDIKSFKIFFESDIFGVSPHQEVQNWSKSDSEFLEYYKTSALTEKNSKHPNFIYIYSESLENTFYNQKIFPNLLNNLSNLRKKGKYFTNINQVYNTGWTIAGMTASQCGVPLASKNVPRVTNQVPSFYAGAKCLGGYLKEGNYSLEYINGGRLVFAGKGKFYHTHGFDYIVGKSALIMRNPMAKFHLNHWGVDDDVMLKTAYNDFLVNSKKNKKFGLFLLTLGTHPPHGFLPKKCKNIEYPIKNNKLSQAIKCSDILLYEFIKKVQNSKYGQNTVIFLSSDHLMFSFGDMKNILSKNQDIRRDSFMILDPRENKSKIIDKKGSMLDVGSTILNVLGYKNNIGLGRNLLDENKTLYTKLDNFNIKLKKWESSFSKFWSLPSLNNGIYVTKQYTKIGNYKYNNPIIMELKSNLNVHLTLTDKDIEKRYSLFSIYKNMLKAKPNSKFIFINKCKSLYKYTQLKKGFCILFKSKNNKKVFKVTKDNYSKNEIKKLLDIK